MVGVSVGKAGVLEGVRVGVAVRVCVCVGVLEFVGVTVGKGVPAKVGAKDAPSVCKKKPECSTAPSGFTFYTIKIIHA